LKESNAFIKRLHFVIYAASVVLAVEKLEDESVF
jgi:hypothetical protein